MTPTSIVRGLSPDGLSPQHAQKSKFVRNFNKVVSDLADLASRDQLLSDVGKNPRRIAGDNRVAARYQFLSGGNRSSHQSVSPVPTTTVLRQSRLQTRPERLSSTEHRNHYDLVDGPNGKGANRSVPVVGRRAVPSEIIRLSMRLAIADALAAKGEPIALVVDDALDTLSFDLQKSAISYLGGLPNVRGTLSHNPDSDLGQQIIVFTADQQVGELDPGAAWAC